MQYDDILKVINGWGRYQKLHFTLLSLVGIFSAFHALNMVFVGAKMDFTCVASPELQTALDDLSNVSEAQKLNLTTPWRKNKKGKVAPDHCYRYNEEDLLDSLSKNQSLENITSSKRESQKCTSGYKFSTEKFKATIVSEWDLVCERSFHSSTLKSVYFAGRLVGAFVGGQLSDRFGRRPVFFIGLIAQVVLGCATAFSTYLPVFYALYFLMGVTQTAVFLVAYVLGTELVEPEKRKLAGFVIQMTYSVGYMLLAGIAFGIQHWQWILLAISLPGLLFLSYWWILPESVRWLLSQKKYEEAKVILEKAAKANKTELTPAVLKSLAGEDEEKESKTENEKIYTVIDIFRSRRMTIVALLVWVNWCVNAMVYYGLALNTSNLGGSPYLNFAIAGAVEIPAYIACMLMIDRLGRRMPLCGFMVLGGVCCIVTVAIPESHMVGRIVCSMLGKLAITASYGIIYLYAAEVFPTVVRNVGMGVSSMSARIGGILAPQILLIGDYVSALPLIIYGALSIAVGLSALILPETAGKKLPELIEDLNKPEYQPPSCPCCKSKADQVPVAVVDDDATL